MATLYVSFFHDTKEVATSYPDTSEKLTISGTAATSAANSLRHDGRVRCATDTACQVEIGAEPVADSDSPYFMPAGHVEYFFVKAGDKVSVISQQ